MAIQHRLHGFEDLLDRLEELGLLGIPGLDRFERVGHGSNLETGSVGRG
jgi:hypothetical protein